MTRFIAGLAAGLVLTLVAQYTYDYYHLARTPENVTALHAMATIDPVDVSLLQLLATPEQFHMSKIRVIGMCSVGFEVDSLWLDEIHYRHAILGNAVWLNLTEEQQERELEVTGKYVILEGVFDMNDPGNAGAYPGSIGNISRLEVWSDPKEPRH